MFDQHAVEARGHALGLKSARQTVTLSGHGRRWLDVHACELLVGDVIAGVGLVHTVTLHAGRRGPGGLKVIVKIEAGEDNEIEYDSMASVRAFVKM